MKNHFCQRAPLSNAPTACQTVSEKNFKYFNEGDCLGIPLSNEEENCRLWTLKRVTYKTEWDLPSQKDTIALVSL